MNENNKKTMEDHCICYAQNIIYLFCNCIIMVILYFKGYEIIEKQHDSLENKLNRQITQQWQFILGEHGENDVDEQVHENL